MKFIKVFDEHSQYVDYIDSSNPKPILPNLSYCRHEDCAHLNQFVETRIIAKYNVTSTSSATTLIYNTSSVALFSELEIDGIKSEVVKKYTFNTLGEHTVKFTLVNPTTIANEMFFSCRNITSIIIPNNITTIGKKSFDICDNLTNITIPNSITSIGDSAFYRCKKLTNIIIPNSVISLGTAIFEQCSSIVSVGPIGSGSSLELPDNINTIPGEIFYDCSNLTTVNIPNNITTIDGFAFGRCSKLSTIICNNLTAPTISNDIFYQIKTNGTLYVPIGSTGYDTWMTQLSSYGWTKVEQ